MFTNIDINFVTDILQYPSLEEIVHEWNSNADFRVLELENNEDSTFLNVIVPNILRVLKNIAKPHDKILDLGCGTGHLTYTLSNSGYNIQGVDVAENVISYAQKKFGCIPFHHASILDFSSDNEGMVNICIANMVLHNIVDLEDNIYAIHKLLKANGFVVASIPNPNVWANKKKLDLKQIVANESMAIYKASFKIRGGLKHPSPITYVHRRIQTYSNFIERAGFKVLDSFIPDITGDGKDNDILFCIWQKRAK